MQKSLIDLIIDGGCYWKWFRENSPGHSIAFPNGTFFKIAIEGSQSHRFIEGTCRDGFFLIEEGEYAHQKFETANHAVNSVREPSSNAFLFTYFQVNGNWELADHLRRMPETMLDKDEEEALNIVLNDDLLPYAARLRGLPSKVEAQKRAAGVISRNPYILEEARRRREFSESWPDVDLSSLL